MGSDRPKPHASHVTVVGAGAAGLFCALEAAAAGATVVLVSRSPLPGSASYWAQGGIAAALGAGDSPELHARDTLVAGRDAARRSAVEMLCADAPARVRQLGELGVRFDADRHGGLALGLEGGHSARRVVHAGGAATGRRITRRLAALAAADERIETLENTDVVALLLDDEQRCVGVSAMTSEGPVEVRSAATVLATGGAAAAWARTTNPGGSVGVGISLALAAGAAVADLELVQFHPTALVSEGPANGFLVSEAIRGEGATLLDGNGERFVDELAPRDEVALAIERVLSETGAGSVGLDLRAIDLQRFPNIAEALDREGIDPAVGTVPVAPAAHYSMGGIACDLDGRSSLDGLLAVGECACTGLHGANRLASNSLAECFVLGSRAARAATAAQASPAPRTTHEAPLPPPPGAATRHALWADAGLRRDRAGLERLAADPHPFAAAVARSALLRAESRGAHQRSDFPETDPALDRHHVVTHAPLAPALEEWS